MSCTDCRFYTGDLSAEPCASCVDRSAFSQVELAGIAARVQDRANELLAGVPDPPKDADPRLVKQCLDANERGDGVLFATLQRGKYLFNVSVKDEKKECSWYRWGGHVWQRDDFKTAQDAVETCALAYQQQANIIDGEIKDLPKSEQGWRISLKKKYQARADRLRSQNGITKTLYFAPIVDQTMACKEGDFNQRPWLLPARNGVINLQNGTLINGQPCDLLTKAIDLDYDPHADYSEWVKFVEEIADGPELAAFLKRTFGYAATGFSHEQYIWVFVGPGRNGKGTLFDLIGDILGPYYHQISRAMLVEQRTEPGPSAASEHKYSLLGKRIIVGDETNKGQKIDASAIKSLTGEDRINCRPNFRSEIVFKPTHTLFLHTHNLPWGLTADFALRQRLLKIEFPWMYVDDPEAEAKKEPAKAHLFRQKDKDLKTRLRGMKQGILRWIVEGCLEWQKGGLAPPESILKAVDDIAAEEDYLGQFLDDCLTHYPGPEHQNVRMSCTKLHDAFRWWWAHNMDNKERRTPGIKSVNTSFRDRGYIVDKAGGKTWLYRFVLNPAIENEVEEWLKKGGKS
jgi:putative DNA primase/helicase